MGCRTVELKEEHNDKIVLPKVIHMLYSAPAMTGTKQGYETTDDAPLIVSLDIGKCTVRQMLIDTESAANVLFRDAIPQIGIPNSDIRPYVLPLIGFTRHSINSSSIIDLPVHVNGTTWCMEFLIVDTLSLNTGHIGRLALN